MSDFMTDFTQPLKDIASIMQNKANVEKLCRDIWNEMTEIDTDRIFGKADTKTYLKLFNILRELKGYITASYNFAIIDLKQYDSLIQLVVDMIREYELKMTLDREKPKPQSHLDPYKFLDSADFEVHH